MSRRMRRPLTATCLMALMFVPALPQAAAADATATIGWVRLAQLSPGTPALDVYLSRSGGTSTQPVVQHLAYGTLSPYRSLAPGRYEVAMRDAGTAPATNPVASTQISVSAGQAYTVAALGPAGTLALQTLGDQLATAPGKAGVRVIEASLRSPAVSVDAGGDILANELRFPNATAYQPVDPGPRAVRISAQGADETQQVTLTAGSTYTLAVIDGTGVGSSPRILDLTDATGISILPKGGVNTGFGGTAQPAGHRSVLPIGWIVLLAAAAGAAGYGASRQRRE